MFDDGKPVPRVGEKDNGSRKRRRDSDTEDALEGLSGATIVSAKRVKQCLEQFATGKKPESHGDSNDDSGASQGSGGSGGSGEEGEHQETVFRFDSDSDNDSDTEDQLGTAAVLCPCCELSTSDLMRDLDKVADSLAGRASHEHVTTMQLKIFEARVGPLLYEGRDNIPAINRATLMDHYTRCRITPLRSVAQDIRLFEEAERMLKSSLTDVDDEGTSILSNRGASELCRLSKGKLDALKFYAQLEKERKHDETNSKKY